MALIVCGFLLGGWLQCLLAIFLSLSRSDFFLLISEHTRHFCRWENNLFFLFFRCSAVWLLQAFWSNVGEKGGSSSSSNVVNDGNNNNSFVIFFFVAHLLSGLQLFWNYTKRANLHNMWRGLDWEGNFKYSWKTSRDHGQGWYVHLNGRENDQQNTCCLFWTF